MMKKKVMYGVGFLLVAGIGLLLGLSKQNPQTVSKTTISDSPHKVSDDEPKLRMMDSVKQQNDQSASPEIEPITDETNDEESLRVEEGFRLLAPMTAFLDDGEELKALYEARKFLTHPNREVRILVVHGLSWIGVAAAPELAQLIDDADGEISDVAQEAFWKAMDEVEKPDLKEDLLAEALKSEIVEVREKVLNESLQLPDALSFPLLTSALNDPDEGIASLARDHLTFIAGEEIDTPEQARRCLETNQERWKQELLEATEEPTEEPN